VEPERALRVLDSIDGAAYAVRIAWAGYWGARIRLMLFSVALVAGAALVL
jgi:hypothetical protein